MEEPRKMDLRSDLDPRTHIPVIATGPESPPPEASLAERGVELLSLG
jgi:hypothetical protein